MPPLTCLAFDGFPWPHPPRDSLTRKCVTAPPLPLHVLSRTILLFNPYFFTLPKSPLPLHSTSPSFTSNLHSLSSLVTPPFHFSSFITFIKLID